MAFQQTWIVDFDETLASGNLTWAFERAFPQFIAEYHLNANPKRLHEVMLVLQEVASRDPSPESLVDQLFERMEWDASLQDQLLNDLFSNYQPTLFEDALPFLERLREKGDRVLVVSNNARTPEQIQVLGIGNYLHGVFTPQLCAGTHPKPDRSMWEYVIGQEIGIDPQTTIVVGDDPWSDGAFAEVCGLRCWIVDRMDRFVEMASDKTYHRVRSLRDIPT